jgi:hypothetical protein
MSPYALQAPPYCAYALEVAQNLTTEIFRCVEGQWNSLAVFNLFPSIPPLTSPLCNPINGSNKCIFPCPYRTERTKFLAVKSDSPDYEITKLACWHESIVWEEPGHPQSEYINGDNWVDIAYVLRVKVDKKTNEIVDKRIEAIWGTGGGKCWVYYKGTKIFSTLVDKAKENIVLW